MLGNQTKNLTVSQLGLASTRSMAHKHGESHLHISYLRPGEPAFIADGDIPQYRRLPRSAEPRKCHEITTTRFLEDQTVVGAVEFADDIYHRMLSPLIDVVCIFVADIGGVNATAARLTAWIGRDQSSSPLVCLALILVVTKANEKDMRAALNEIECGPDGPRLAGCFSQ
ncbi:hypothetical protein S40288_11442, partial [Stachybotrys chartarum IBT 40288]